MQRVNNVVSRCSLPPGANTVTLMSTFLAFFSSWFMVLKSGFGARCLRLTSASAPVTLGKLLGLSAPDLKGGDFIVLCLSLRGAGGRG